MCLRRFLGEGTPELLDFVSRWPNGLAQFLELQFSHELPEAEHLHFIPTHEDWFVPLAAPVPHRHGFTEATGRRGSQTTSIAVLSWSSLSLRT